MPVLLEIIIFSGVAKFQKKLAFATFVMYNTKVVTFRAYLYARNG